MDNQSVFVNLTSENMEDAKKLKEGSVITVKYSGSNIHNKLIRPVFYRSRIDMTWKELVDQYNVHNKK